MAVEDDSDRQSAMKILLCGGIAGIATWVSIFPLDVIKTRLQTQILRPDYQSLPLAGLVRDTTRGTSGHGAIAIAKQIYRQEGSTAFFRGLTICSVRAFIVNAVQVSPMLNYGSCSN